MKICQFSAWELSEKAHEAQRDHYKQTGIITLLSPAERAVQVLLGALETVNQAGLDGKKLSNIHLIQKTDPSKHFDDQIIEIHADVTHRLATKTNGT